jgi:hypothetical protein
LNPIPSAKAQFGDLPPELLESVIGPMLRGVEIGRVAQTSKGAQKQILPYFDPKTIDDKKALLEAMCKHLTDSSERCLSKSNWPLNEIPREWASYARDHKLNSISCESYCLQEWPQHFGKAFVDTMMANMGQQLAFLFVAVPVNRFQKVVEYQLDKLPLFTGKLIRFDVKFKKHASGEHSEEDIQFSLGAKSALGFREQSNEIVGMMDRRVMEDSNVWRETLLQTWEEQERKSDGLRYINFAITLTNANPGIQTFVENGVRTGIVKQIPTDNKQAIVWPYPMRVHRLFNYLTGSSLMTMDVLFPNSSSKYGQLEAPQLDERQIYPPGLPTELSYYRQFF